MYPALAVVPALKAQLGSEQELHLLWVGSRDGMEQGLV
ncbi:MAG: hypothetical protein R3264_17875, partial [Anaerolineae bacterium]|nr:hypothetical protein [Anaerolineae bacterium]